MKEGEWRMREGREMKIVGIIPARGESKGIPNKNIKMLKGKPVIAWTIEHALGSKYLDRIIVSTDSKKIANISKKYGAEVVMRPKELAGDDSPIELTLRHVVSTLKEKEDYKVDIVVLMQANVPVRKEGTIDEVVEKLISSKADSVMTVYEVNQRPEWMKRLKGERLIPYMRCNLYRRQDLPKLYIADGAVAAIKRKILMDTEGKVGVHEYLGRDIRAVIQEPLSSIEIDRLSDFKLAEWVLSQRMEDEA